MSMVKSSLKRWHWIAGPTCLAAASLCFTTEVASASDCTSCDAVGNSCPAIVIDLPEVPCLGNGLFDHFNRFADRFSRKSSCNCAGTSNTCDGLGDSLAVSNHLMPTYTARTHNRDENTSTAQLPSEVPEMPSAPAPIPAPEPRDGYRTRTPAKASDPFIDEARSKTIRSTLPSSIGYEEVHVMKMNSRLAALMNPSRNQAIAKKVEQDASEPNVITVSGTKSSEETFVR